MRTWIVFVGLILAKVFLLARSQQCRRCDQIISGRNLAYSRALEIIQEEDYLDEDEFDEIRYKRHLKVKNPYKFQKKYGKLLASQKRPRTKRQTETEVVTNGKKLELSKVITHKSRSEVSLVQQDAINLFLMPKY